MDFVNWVWWHVFLTTTLGTSRQEVVSRMLGGATYQAQFKQTNKPITTTKFHKGIKELDREKQCFSGFSVFLPMLITLNGHIIKYIIGRDCSFLPSHPGPK